MAQFDDLLGENANEQNGPNPLGEGGGTGRGRRRGGSRDAQWRRDDSMQLTGAVRRHRVLTYTGIIGEKD